jgi:putative helicase MOV10L1
MVISTVISRVGSDASTDDALGFLANPRRFNVAVSRAQALNIVVGHPVPLATWPHWHALLRHALARGAYTGAGALDDGAAPEDELAAAVARLAELTLLGSADNEGDAVHVDGDSFYGDERG